MTTFTVPPAGSRAWQEIYPVPPLVRLETVGPWCPLDESRLQVREDGWNCTVCAAAWDFHGQAGRWLNRPVSRPSVITVLAGVAGCAAAAVVLVAFLTELGDLDERLVWWLAAAIAVAGVLYPAGSWAARQVTDWWPYRHNRVVATYSGTGQALGGSEVSDEQ